MRTRRFRAQIMWAQKLYSRTYVNTPSEWIDSGSNYRILVNSDYLVVHQNCQSLVGSFGQLIEKEDVWGLI